MVAENEAGTEGFGYAVAEKAEFLYTDDGLVASTNPLWLQWKFDVIIGLFERLRLQTNVAKTVAMVCQPGPVSGQQSTAAYGLQMTDEGTLIE